MTEKTPPEDGDNALQKEINKAKKPKVVAIDSKRAYTQHPNGIHKGWQRQDGNYQVINNAFCQNKATKEGDIIIKLCNFIAEITEEFTHQDDLADKSYIVISGTREDGQPLPPAQVPINQFNTMNWPTEAWTSRAIIDSGTTKKDNIRVAILLYSNRNGDIPRRVVYGRLGWLMVDGQCLYLTGNGAIGKDGLDSSVQVDLGAGHMSRYTLPVPPTAEQLKADATALLDLLNLCPSRPEIAAILLAAIARAPLGECSPTDFIIFIHGQTGSFKSELAALPLAFFGDFTARSFPANFSDTELELESKAHQAKDSIYIIDDYKPAINAVMATQQATKAENFIRNTGNQAGRGRRNPDGTAKKTPYNRSLAFMTGEDIPNGQSARARLLLLELSNSDVNRDTLSRLQQAARDGTLRRIMASYIQWLAAHMDSLKQAFPDDIRRLRDITLRQGHITAHGRTPEMFANMIAAISTLADYLKSQNLGGLINEDAIEQALMTAFKSQKEYQTEQDEVERFAELLRSVLSSGHGHLCLAQDQSPPGVHPHRYGWRKSEGDIVPNYTPLGDLFGWLWYDEKNERREMWLDKTAAYRLAIETARKAGEPFLMSSGTLWRRLHNRGLLLKTERGSNSTGKLDIKRTIAGTSQRVIIIAESWLLPAKI